MEDIMKVVTCYRASRIAQVSKQLIGNHKKVNSRDKSKYSYFAYDKDTGKFGVDIESDAWLEYMERRRLSLGYDPNKKNQPSTLTNIKSTVDQRENSDYMDDLIRIVKKTLNQIYDADADEQDMFILKMLENVESK